MLDDNNSFGNNKRKFGYIGSFDKSSDEGGIKEERVERRVTEVKVEEEISKRAYKGMREDEDRKRLRVDLDRLEKKFPEVFDVKGKVKFCKVEECDIVTEEGKRVVKRGLKYLRYIGQRFKNIWMA